mgnify:CR=1 FL=1
MQALHFGAGNIGRGFIGYLLNKTGYDICFVDVNEEIIKSINETNSYVIELLDEDQTRETVSPVSALNSINDREKVIEEISKIDLITTSVGVENLSKIAGILAEGLLKRIDKNQKKIDVIANENAINASSTLKEEIKEHLSAKEIDKLNDFVGFPNSAIDRLALSKQTEEGEIALVEPFYEWVINKSEIKNKDLPSIEDAIYVENLDPYIKRKLYLINMSHAATAYIGFLADEKTIQSSLKISEIESFIRSVLDEVKQYIVEDSHFTAENINSYIEKTLKRFKNENISDNVLRVGRAPIRKLGYDERLIKPLRKLNELDLPLKNLTKVIATAFSFDNPEDEEAVRLQEYIKNNGIENAITNFTEIEDKELINKIEKQYYRLKDIGVKKLIAQ